ncbi:MAG: hypothetical protein NC402_02000 [Prevotella sp.]|nr:hypothetical protein [Prevotella sp.]MCM1074296.1 hypothetical protein [Ruminococcus sp.]
MSNLNRIKRMDNEPVSPELAVAQIVAAAFNHFDTEILTPILAPEFRYVSVSLKDSIDSKEQALAYIDAMFDAMREHEGLYTATVQMAENEAPVVSIRHDKENNAQLWVLTITDGKLTEIFHRYDMMLTVADLANERILKTVMAQTFHVIHNWLPFILSEEQIKEEDFEMLQQHPLPDDPTGQFTFFRVKDKKYSCIVTYTGQYHTEDEGHKRTLVSADTDTRLKECERLGYIPCEIVLDVNLLSVPQLLNEQTAEPIIF